MSSKKMPHMSSDTGKRALPVSTVIVFMPLSSNEISGTSTEAKRVWPSSFIVTLSPAHVISRSYQRPVSMGAFVQSFFSGVAKSKLPLVSTPCCLLNQPP